jgi:hypothetical protein
LSDRLSSLTKENESLNEDVGALKKTVYILEAKISELEEESTLSGAEKYERRERKVFDQAEDLTLVYLRQLTLGAILKLISCSYYYPHQFPVFGRFEYKYDHIDEESLTKFGYEVHGFSRYSPLDEWKPYEFLIKETEASTSSCSGTIKVSDHGVNSLKINELIS